MGKPDPEEEEIAQKDLVKFFAILDSKLEKEGDGKVESEISDEIKVLLSTINSWDPLELWFDEVAGLNQMISDFLKKFRPGDILLVQSNQPEENLKEKIIPKIEENKEIEKPSVTKNVIEDYKISENDKSEYINDISDSKIEKRLEFMQNKMAKLMKKEKIPKNLNLIDSNREEFLKTKKKHLIAPKIKIPHVIRPKSIISPHIEINLKKSEENPNIKKSKLKKKEEKNIDPIKIPTISLSKKEQERDKKNFFKPKISNVVSKSRIIRKNNLSKEGNINLKKNHSKLDELKEKEYQKLINLESKKYFAENEINSIEEKYQNGQINEDKFKKSISKNNSLLINLNSKIDNIQILLEKD